MLVCMTDDVYLTPTDVSEALNCTLDATMELIASGRLPAIQSRGWKVAHSDLSRFIASAQHEALQLGHDSIAGAAFALSRPADDDAQHRSDSD